MFSTQTTRVRGEWIAGRAVRGAHLLGREAACDSGQAARDDPRVDRRAAELGDEDVAVLLADELVARLGVQPQRDLVRHRRRRKEDRLVLAEQRRRALLELVHGRVLALLLVADERRRRSPRACPRVGRVAVSERRSITAAHATVRDVDLALLDDVLAARGEPAFRARQVWEWAARGVAGYDEMTNLPAALREALAEEVPFSTLTLEDEAHAADGTVKALFRTADGHPVEAVLMRYRDGRRSICVSSQSGCPLTCTFCATGAMAFGRNLTASRDPRPGAPLPPHRAGRTTSSSWGWASRC